jgi:large subunit ribosomal protein L21
MSKLAVIKTGGKQYLVQENQELVVDYLPGDSKKKEIVFDKILLVIDGETIHLGKPYLTKAKIMAEIIEQGRGEKIRVARFRAKSRYRKVRGFRQELTKVKILKIEIK